MSFDLDPRFTFDSFVTGAANRLAYAAARRVAESPGTTYNPLFIYSASGLGKTHLITAIGHHARRIHPHLSVVYDTLEHFMEEVMSAIQTGERDAFRTRISGAPLLLLDDVQFLAGQLRTQEELLRAWDALSARGGQVVLASDRPPTEIDGLDQRLLSRFSGGLIVDIGAPDFETRVAIVRRKAEERSQQLGEGVAEALARISFGNVRELQGALNRVLAAQELEGHAVTASEVAVLLGLEPAGEGKPDEFGAFLSEISGMVGEVVAARAADRELAAAILRWEGEGYATRRLEAALSSTLGEAGLESVLASFEQDIERLREIAGEIHALEPEAPELGQLNILRDPDRVSEAEALLEGVRERARPLPEPPSHLGLDQLTFPADLLALRAARAIAEQPGQRYNPLFIHGPAGAGKTTLLGALGYDLRRRFPDLPIAFMNAADFAAELISALERNRMESWRARLRRARVFLLDDVDALGDTERAQEELFHLFDALQRSGVQLAFTAASPPREVRGLESRLRSRLESGLVVELPAPARVEEAAGSTGAGLDDWYLARDRILWSWPYVEDLLVEELE